MPSPQRQYYREEEEATAGSDETDSIGAIEENRRTADPAPTIFADPLPQEAPGTAEADSPTTTFVDPEYQKPQEKRILDRINPWSGKEEPTP